MIAPYPLLLKPAYKHYIWGGRRIIENFNRKVPQNVYAESWEASDREEGMSLVQNGALQGLALKEVLAKHPHFFTKNELHRFPLLIKLIDAQKSLSIQVHPNDKSASLFGGEAKSEMWHVIAAKEGSKIYLGLKKPLSHREIREAIDRNDLETFMHQISVRQGDTFYIPGGLLHSIGEGCLIYEVQQNSDTTYRLYDWGRVDSLGKSRELHVERALKVMLKDQQINAHKVPKVIQTNNNHQYNELLACPYFKFYKYHAKAPLLLKTSSCLRVFFVLSGNIFWEDNKKSQLIVHGQTFIVPPGYPSFKLLPKEGAFTLLETISN